MKLAQSQAEDSRINTAMVAGSPTTSGHPHAIIGNGADITEPNEQYMHKLQFKEETTASHKNNGAFTMIEIIVVMAIIAALVAALIPAVLSVRESARKAQCSSNLRQVGMGLQSYHGVHGIYPAGVNGYGFSFHACILPYLEQSTVYHSLNFDARGKKLSEIALEMEMKNSTASVANIATFVCPSDGLSRPDGNKHNNSYAGNRGVGFDRTDHNDDGMFPSSIGLPGVRHFRDGASYTVGVSEWKRDQNTFDTSRSFANPDEFIEVCNSLGSHGDPRIKDANWMRGGFGTTLYNHFNAINKNTCFNSGGMENGAWTAGSHHPGGASALFADGHVQFLRDGIRIETWRAIGTRGGGEVTSGGY